MTFPRENEQGSYWVTNNSPSENDVSSFVLTPTHRAQVCVSSPNIIHAFNLKKINKK